MAVFINGVQSGAGSGDVAGPSSSVNNAIVRYDGTGGKTVQGYTSSDPTISDLGALILTEGQLTFPATANPSADSNTLDDYEEGTWTPVITFATAGDLSVVYTTQLGTYTKKGREVTITIDILTSTFTHTTASSSFDMTGLPFTSLTLSGYASSGAVTVKGLTKATYTNFVIAIGSNSAQMELDLSGSGVTNDFADVADMPTAGIVVLRGTLTYWV